MSTKSVQQEGDPSEVKLYDSERRFRLLVEGVVDYAIYFLDPQGRITNWNAGAQRIKGYQADEIIGQHFGIFYPPEDREKGLPHQSLETARTQGKYEATGWRVRKDGTRFQASVVIDPLYEDGALVGYAKITRDLTERTQAEAALQSSQRNFEMLVSAVTDYALYMIDPDGFVSSWNAGGERIKGYSPREIIGQHFSRFYTELDRRNGRPARALRIARESGRYEEEGWRVRKDGSFFWASVVIDPIRDDRGGILGYAKITRDITERRNAQIALEKVQKQLAEAQKMEALGQLTGGVAHDFNNLLMIIAGHIQFLKAHVHDPKAYRAAEAIETATMRGSNLTRQLLTFSRRQRVNPEKVNLGASIIAFRQMLTSGLRADIRLVIDIPEDTWPVTIDPREFEIALVNLVLNSRDAMPNGGQITITADNVSLAENGTTTAGDYVALRVRDEGTGIPDDVRARVFDPFFTTKSVGKGTGLGLSQVHGFVHQAGGTVQIDSVVGKGTTVTLFVPRHLDDESRRQEPASAVQAATVLLVEDNPDVATACISLLETLGYKVRWVPDAQSALDDIAQNRVDVVFSDIVMPGRLDGLGLAREIKQKYPGLPVLLATGYSEAAQAAQSDFPILRKPFQMQELSSALAAISAKAAGA